jgi:hypothetical protein
MIAENLEGRERPAFDVFISHSLPDIEIANELALRLRHLGLSVFSDQSDVANGGDHLLSYITRVVSTASAVVVLVSPEYATSQWAQSEMTLARENAEVSQSLLIPVTLPGTALTSMPRQLMQFQGIQLRTRKDIGRLADQIYLALQGRNRSPGSDQQNSAALLEQTLADSVRVLGPEHPSTLSTRANLANVYLQEGRTTEASLLLEQTLADSVRVLGPEHPLTRALGERHHSVSRSLGGAN